VTSVSDNKKCLLVTPHFLPLIGGALTVYDALARETGGDIQILTASTDYVDGSEVVGWESFDQNAPYSIERIPALRTVRDRKEPLDLLGRFSAKLYAWYINRAVLKKTLKMLDETGANCLCIGSLDTLGWLSRAIKKRTSVKVTIYIHGEEVSQTAYSKISEYWRYTSLHAADTLIAVSHFTANIIHSKYGVSHNKISVQNNGVDLQKYNGILDNTRRNELEFPSERYVFACGRLVARKGFDRLIEIWPQVLEKIPDIHLVIGGEGSLKGQLEDQVVVLGLSDNISFLGWIPDEIMPFVYGFADVFIMPNRTLPDGDTEGFGLVFLEAAAMGTPSIGGNAGGVPEAIIDGETGVLVDGDEMSSILDALLDLLMNDEKRVRMAKNSYEYAQTQGWTNKAQGVFNAMISE